MPIRFAGPERPRSQISFIKYPPAKYVRLLGGQAAKVLVHLHWVGTFSVPCQGDECLHCPLSTFLAGYIPAEFGNWTTTSFTPLGVGILHVTEEVWTLAVDDWENKIVRMTRAPEHASGAMIARLAGAVTTKASPGFDVLARMLSIWRSNENKIAMQLASLQASAKLIVPPLKIASGE